MKRHLALKIPARPTQLPDLSLLEGIIAPGILDAVRIASRQLASVGIRHALVGGLAVSAYGYPRTTKDVDFLVGDEAFAHHGSGIVTISPGIPIEVHGVAVDPISIAPNERHLDTAVAAPAMSDGIPIAPIEALLYLKLKSPRRRDAIDVVELLRNGIAATPVRRYLASVAPELLAKFDALAEEAETDDDQ
jgi:hypothetical protein